MVMFLVGLSLASIVLCGAYGWRQKIRNHILSAQILNQRQTINLILDETHQARQAANTAQELAEAASIAKSDFLANTSHEIRTPMSAVLGMARLLLDSPLTPEQQSWAEIIRDSGESLLSIINDILDLSKIDAGFMTLSMHDFDVYQAMTDVTDLLIHKCEQKNIALLVDIAPDVPRFVIGDSVRIKQVILNLLSNAVKFTAEGYVRLTLHMDPSDPHHHRLLYTVEDTGIGIASDKIRYIFGKFTQAEESTTRRFGGTGLGLAITYKLVTLMQGHIAVESCEGKGSRFALTIPIKNSDQQLPVIFHGTVAGQRILILADNPQRLTIAKHYALQNRMAVSTCSHAIEVLTVLHDAERHGEFFDYILIDHCIGGAQTIDLIDRIRLFPAFESIAFIVIGTLGSASTVRLMNSHKIAALLSRPLFPDQFSDALDLIHKAKLHNTKPDLITRSSIEKLRRTPTDTVDIISNFSGAHILVVEDIDVNQILMAKILEKLHCKVDAAKSGYQALSKIQDTTYDLIFMDGHMPEMDGFEATRRIRHMERNKDQQTVIVALTADAMNGDAEKYINAGMNDYLTKPVTPEKIAATLGKWMVKK